MLIGTLKAQKRLTDAGADDRLAEALVEILASAREQVVTKEDLDERMGTLRREMKGMEERLKKTMSRVALGIVGITLAALAICTTIIVSYG
jgi:predicted ATP-grasp superfamily ATP-dependent carboligase